MIRKFILLFLCSGAIQVNAQTIQSFNSDWEFVKGIDTVFAQLLLEKKSEIRWEKISLPHTANIEPIQKINQQWQGTCFYRKYFSMAASERGEHIALRFDAAMQVADVYLNGKHIAKHLGGYLPFYLDVSDKILFNKENILLVKLNNQDNPEVPPGKPLKDLDFNYYSGIYRNVWLIVKDKLYITDAVAANRTAGGGNFLHYENVTQASATLSVKTEIANDFTKATDAQVQLTFTDRFGKTAAQSLSKSQSIGAASAGTFTQSLVISNPDLWSPESPYLYKLTVELIQRGKVVDKEIINSGIKTVRLEKDALYLNDKKIILRGTNRHQEYPYVGNALSDNAQYRDAWKIKLAGFNFVRCSHYPQSPAFLDACDELGIMVMDAIPGWQFVGDGVFQKNSFQNIHDMIHRDRNHVSIILWEASLNETYMKKDYMQKAHAIVHEEIPFSGVYSTGWIDDVYDVFLPARQHAKAPDYWKKRDAARPFLIAEYGDWEYYAQNAGFNQTMYKDLKEGERTSRQVRGSGEKALLQQALNYQEAHNDNLYCKSIGDANWLMFDYNRGYADDIESSGIMDITRLPKFSFYFYQSQVDPVLTTSTEFNKPMVFIANDWQNNSATDIRVFSNCTEVEVLLNGKSIGRQRPDTDANSTNLKHPPFTFKGSSFQPGTLTAIGYIGNKEIVKHEQQTAEQPAAINLRADYSGKNLMAGQNDIIFVYAAITDNKGMVVPSSSESVKFSVTGDATIVGLTTVPAEAGIATIVLKAGPTPGKIIVSAACGNLKTSDLALKAK